MSQSTQKNPKKSTKCKFCANTPTKRILHAEGMAYIDVCDNHLVRGKEDCMRATPDGTRDPSNINRITDLAVSSRVYPGLERKPGGPDNWVEATGGLPTYIERIAKHLHYERGYSISRAIATAVNTVKRWARKGTVTKTGTSKLVTSKTQAQAAKAVAEWERKKASARATRHGTLRPRSVRLSEETKSMSDLLEAVRSVSDPAERSRLRERILDLAGPPTAVRRELASEGKAMPHGGFPIRNVQDLKNAIQAIGRAKDPAAAKRHIIRRARALGHPELIPKTWNLSEREINVIDLARGRTRDGRPSFKNQGKWGHGFVPLDDAAKRAKAKGSPIAMRRMRRLYGNVAVKSAVGGTERATSVSRLQRPEISNTKRTQRIPKPGKEASKGGAVKKRSEQSWESIPDEQKTIRNGKRYVLTIFRGENQLTEWVGPDKRDTETGFTPRRYSAVTGATLQKLSTAQLRQLLDVPGQPMTVKRAVRAMIRQKESKS